jgi:hypothetical protein
MAVLELRRPFLAQALTTLEVVVEPQIKQLVQVRLLALAVVAVVVRDACITEALLQPP